MRMEIQLENRVEIALAYPWTLSDNAAYFHKLQTQIQGRTDLYYNRETLILSPLGHPIELVVLSSGELRHYPEEQYLPGLYPYRQKETHFKKIFKPLIVIVARVHPGETGSSYALKGILDFLTSDSELARKMLKDFYFLVIPILNPDGVFLGNNRLDFYGQNLNRYYLCPEREKQPSCYAVKELLEGRKQMSAFFDLHGHVSKKSCFLFGNCLEEPKAQIEAILYVKYLSLICDSIEFKACDFSKQQMASKDKNDGLSKEGCARVVVYRWTNSPFCYTLETGLYKNVTLDDKGIERYGDKFYSPHTYQEIGFKILLAFSTLKAKSKILEEIRRSLSGYLLKFERMNQRSTKYKREVQGVISVGGKQIRGSESRGRGREKANGSQEKELVPSCPSLTPLLRIKGQNIPVPLRNFPKKNRPILLIPEQDDD